MQRMTRPGSRLFFRGQRAKCLERKKPPQGGLRGKGDRRKNCRTVAEQNGRGSSTGARAGERELLSPFQKCSDCSKGGKLGRGTRAEEQRGEGGNMERVSTLCGTETGGEWRVYNVGTLFFCSGERVWRINGSIRVVYCKGENIGRTKAF